MRESRQAFTEKFAKSAEATEQARELIPGGYSRATFNFGPHAIFVRGGRGAYLETIEGHRLLDLNNNYTVNILGHAHPAIEGALADGIRDGISFGNPVTAEAELAQLLVERIPSVERVQFSCSATESCLSAIRVARAFTGKTKIAKFEGGYHGFTDFLHVSSHTGPDDDHGPDAEPHAVADSGGIPAGALEGIVVLPQNDRESTERLLRAHAGELACVILELQSGSGGLVTLEPGFVAAIRELTAKLGIVLIFDETISLRAGFHGAQGRYGVLPDLTVMGKMIGGGLPLGALGGSAELMTLLADGTVTVSGTHHGHKLALLAGAACLRAMDAAAFDRLNAQAARIVDELSEWGAARRSPLLVYGGGYSHLGYAYLKRRGLTIRSHRDFWRNVDVERTQTCSLELANRGFFPVHRGEISLSVPMTDDDISSFIHTMQEIVTELEASRTTSRPPGRSTSRRARATARSTSSGWTDRSASSRSR